MNIRVFYRLMLFGLLALIIISVVAAYAAGISMPESSVGFVSNRVDVNDLKPPECTMDLEEIINGSGLINGTIKSELIFGSSGLDIIVGGGGDDCIFGLGGDDNITTGDGDDIIYGGDGDDTCDGGGGANIINTCEP